MKNRSLGRKQTHLKKKVFARFLSSHPSFELTRWFDWFTSSQLQTQILNETNPAKALDHLEKF